MIRIFEPSLELVSDKMESFHKVLSKPYVLRWHYCLTRFSNVASQTGRQKRNVRFRYFDVPKLIMSLSFCSLSFIFYSFLVYYFVIKSIPVRRYEHIYQKLLNTANGSFFNVISLFKLFNEIANASISFLGGNKINK